MSHIHFDWPHLALPLAIIANTTSLAAVIYARATRHKIDALIKLLAPERTKVE